MLVIANKIDLVNERERAEEDILLETLDVKYPEIMCRQASVYGGVLVNEAMTEFATLLYQNQKSYIT